MRTLNYRQEIWQLAKPFAISSGTYHSVEVLVAEIRENETVGRGEAAGVFFQGETMASMVGAIESVRSSIESGVDRANLATLLPAGGARNALDCALWELEARSLGSTVSEIAGIPARPLEGLATVSLGTPAEMAECALACVAFGVLKLKLGAQDPISRVQAVRAARPDARLIVDVNAGWTVAELHQYAPGCAELGVEMIEQPCAPEHDLDFWQADIPVPLCADESCCTSADLDRLAGRFAMINIKLDKTGGLTEALELARAAQVCGFSLMVGNMMGTALAMAPASLVGTMCRYVDLDGPLLLAAEREPAMQVDGAIIAPMVPSIWG